MPAVVAQDRGRLEKWNLYLDVSEKSGIFAWLLIESNAEEQK